MTESLNYFVTYSARSLAVLFVLSAASVPYAPRTSSFRTFFIQS